MCVIMPLALRDVCMLHIFQTYMCALCVLFLVANHRYIINFFYLCRETEDGELAIGVFFSLGVWSQCLQLKAMEATRQQDQMCSF